MSVGPCSHFEMITGRGKSKKNRHKSVPKLRCPPRISHEITRNWKWGSAVRIHHLNHPICGIICYGTLH